MWLYLPLNTDPGEQCVSMRITHTQIHCPANRRDRHFAGLTGYGPRSGTVHTTESVLDSQNEPRTSEHRKSPWVHAARGVGIVGMRITPTQIHCPANWRDRHFAGLTL